MRCFMKVSASHFRSSIIVFSDRVRCGIFIVSWRGYQGKDAPEHLVMGEVMPQFLDTMKIPHRTLSEQTAIDDLKWLAETFMQQRVPVALLITKGVVRGLHP